MTDQSTTTPKPYREIIEAAVYRPPGFRVQEGYRTEDAPDTQWYVIHAKGSWHQDAALGWHATARQAFEAINRGEYDR